MSDRFRRDLAAALDLWVSEGLITPEQRQRLRDYYQVDQLTQQAGGTFALVLFILGGILIGLGVISFVAANWQGIPRGVRALGALGLMVGLQGAGYRLWRGSRARLGTALLVMGELTLGASIGLMAQWFQVSGPVAGLLGYWGLGVVAVAYGIRHTPSGILGLGLLLLGALDVPGNREVWFYHPALLPWLALGLGLPLAYWCRSRGIWVLGLLLLALGCAGLFGDVAAAPWGVLLFVALSWGWAGWHQRWLPWLQLHLAPDPQDQTPLDFVPMTVFLAASLLLGSLYAQSFWFNQEHLKVPELGLAKVLSLWGLALLAVTLWIGNAQHMVGRDPRWQVLQRGLQIIWVGLVVLTGLGLVWRGVSLVVLWGSSVALAIGGVVGIAVIWWQQQSMQERNWWRSQSLLALAWLTLVVVSGTGSWWGLKVIWVNLALLVASGSLVWQGLMQGSRWRFWLGLLFLSLTVMTRFFEYDTGLLLKSLALVLCGVGVILAGIRFEQSLGRR